MEPVALERVLLLPAAYGTSCFFRQLRLVHEEMPIIAAQNGVSQARINVTAQAGARHIIGERGEGLAAKCAGRSGANCNTRVTRCHIAPLALERRRQRGDGDRSRARRSVRTNFNPWFSGLRYRA